ncbi:MAG: ABC transporter permease [Rhodospirillaceae bacterium]|jgi:spermidine/putrescine transport system permease protein|uniref:ABC transporter permease n=1 Tax=unclassified Hwanghaeella TaxID=2605944 RepID=UPI000C45D327|nr:ABC transporter permease [Rhodospirillales bacterium]MAX47043.1 ABC transporter permease [Rhodospirillaceae bacterium]|tara:strand:+ start:16331 stop:17293 length:963 start_codon:yes stop_codon:yes gene_type:complete
MDAPGSNASTLDNAAQRLAHAKAAHEDRARKTRRFLLSPAVLVIGIVGLFPLTITILYSVLSPDTYGGVVWKLSGEGYLQFLFERDIFDDTLTFSTSYLQIYGRSIALAFFTTIGALLLGFPTAYFIASKPREQRTIWLFLITLPFWVNLLIRTYAMLLILRDEGIINISLIKIGLIDDPINILYTSTAVFIGLVYSYLPFMVLPLYASLEKLDFKLVEAGYDLYATRFQVLRNIILPLTKPGIVAGCILVFIPGLGAYITPELLGGGKELMIGNLIALQFGSSRNWPFGSAAALILMAVVMIALLVYVRYSGKEGARHG